ncbi:unnamed protein product [Brachionus calyciflorus]|uniref:Homeobox domain-containing protein n=1 Tax=Brachionus calyciflorus TaxID=104777 RepID=A0A814EQQ4_9BILA|nr:unnamed protein product [Brachionus calyciflorus]
MESRSQSPISPLTVNVNSSECSTPVKESTNGLLAYSTPLFYHFNYAQKTTPFVSQIKPKVNFHSIADLVGSESDDSGFQSLATSVKESPVVSFKQKLDEAEQDKENSKKCDNGKKFRTTFTEEQKLALDAYFQKNPYPDPKETEDLSQQLVLPENVIKVWFQNKRSRDKQRKFSSKSRKSQVQSQDHSQTASPIVANLQLLQSRLNQYAALTAVVQNSPFYSQQFY